MKNSYNKKIFYLNEKNIYDKNISYWIQNYFHWIKILFWYNEKSDIIIYFIEYKFTLIEKNWKKNFDIMKKSNIIKRYYEYKFILIE